ncbi:MAG: hypothetical protein ACI35P_17260 [Bacillus sp. (in: firmicutes)]
MIKMLVKSMILLMMMMYGYKYRYKLMNAVLSLEGIRELIVSKSMKFPKGSIPFLQR